MRHTTASGNADRPRILILDDDVGFLDLSAFLLKDSFAVTTVSDEDGLWDHLDTEEPDVLLLDIWLGEDPDAGFAVYQKIRDRGYRLPVILLSMKTGLAVTGRAAALGIPFLQKDDRLDAETFKQQLTQVLRLHALQTEVLYHRDKTMPRRRITECPWSDSATGRRVRELLQPFLGTARPLILVGEQGVGKKTTARWVANQRPEDSLPIVELSLRGHAPNLVDGAIFGAAGAGPGDMGVFEAAGEGTVILIGLECAPHATLRRLEKALETRNYRRPGVDRTLRLRSRVIATYLAETPEMLAAFQPGLSASGSVVLPPLREHPEDLEFHARNIARQLDLPETSSMGRLSREDLESLRSDPFPGNLHDLKAMVLRGVVAVHAARAISSGDLTETLLWEHLANRDWRFVEQYCLERYSQAVERRLGRDSEAWMNHTGFSRATVYRRFFESLTPPQDPER